MSSPKIKNISLFQKCKPGYITAIPSRPEGRSRSSRTWDGDAVDGKGATDERGRRVRQRRVVPTPRCWRQCTWRQQLSGRHGGKRAVLRGDHVISRKAIAQGLSDVLRCPVCSCAHSFYHCTSDRGGSDHRAFPAPSFSIEGEEFQARLGRNGPREREGVS